MLRMNSNLLACVASFCFLLPVEAATPESLSQATHKQIRVIAPKMENADVHLNTFAMAPNGKLWFCCTPSQGNPSEKETAAGSILVYDVNGELDRSIPIDFIPQWPSRM